MNFFIDIFQVFWLHISEQTPIFYNTSQMAASAEAYSETCEDGAFIVNIINGLKSLTIFTKKLHLRCLTRFCVCLCSEVTSSIYQTYNFKVYCHSFWRHYNLFDLGFACTNETLCPLSYVTLSKNLDPLCDYMFATNTNIIIYIT